MRFDPLVANSDQPEGESEQPRAEHGYIIGPQDLGSAEVLNTAGNRMEQGSRGFVLKSCEYDIRAGAMVEDAEKGVQLVLVIDLAGEIETPESVLGAGRQLPVFKLLANDLDVITVFPDDLTHEGLAHGRTLGGIAAIEDHGDVPAPQIRALGAVRWGMRG